MKNKLLYILTALLALPFVACKEDVDLGKIDVVNDLDRMPMTMFRRLENTGIGSSDEADPYATRCITDKRNTIHLAWHGIEGCAGYEIRYALRAKVGYDFPENWDDDDLIIDRIIINDPNTLKLDIENLEYSTTYAFIIRTLSPKGEEHHSLWYGLGTQREWADYQNIQTEPRYPTPALLWCSDKDYEEFTVNFNLDYASSGDNATNDYIGTYGTYDKQHFFIDEATGKYIAHTLVVQPSPTNPDANYPSGDFDAKGFHTLTAAELESGQVRVKGLSPNSVYVAYLVNNNVTIPVDAMYNITTYRTYGDPGEPILIRWSTAAPDRNDVNNPRYWKDGEFDESRFTSDVEEHEASIAYNACRIDTVISNYTSNITLAEGQTFYLEGDKDYYFEGNTTLCKGFTLRTLPEDLAQGKHARVYLGGIRMNGNSVVSNNFMFGRTPYDGEADAPISVDRIVFSDIDWDCPMAGPFGTERGAQGNYFANMYSNGMAVTMEGFEVHNCTFQRMIRGFIRVQGTKVKQFNEIVVDGCVFYNCGYYDTNGRGYAWFAGDGASPKSNVFKNVWFTNNTVYDSPRTSMFTDNGKDLAWGEDVSYHIHVNNNTFINYSTRTAGRYIFDFKFIPGGSTISVKDNLFVVTKDASDQRNVYFSGMSIQNVNGSGLIAFDIKGNYSSTNIEGRDADDKIFSGNGFTANKASAATYKDLPAPWGLVNSEEDLIVRVGSEPILSTTLFANPNPPYTAHDPTAANARDHEGPANIWNDLRINTSLNHEIVRLQVGDKRWYSADPRNYYNAR